jgi:Flp pilus assembly protein TadD
MDGGVNYVSDGTMIAKILLLKKEDEKAFETLKGLYSLTKKNKTLITAYSNALIKKNKFFEAVEIIDNSKIEESAELYNLKAVALLRQGKTEDAYDILQKAIMVDKNYVPAIVNMGVVNMLKGNEEVAIKLFNDALKKDPSNETAKINLEKLSIKNKLQIKQ